jgi:hypothetical protein
VRLRVRIMMDSGALEQGVLRLSLIPPPTNNFIIESFSRHEEHESLDLIAVMKSGTSFFTRHLADRKVRKRILYTCTSSLGCFSQYSDFLRTSWPGFDSQHAPTVSDSRSCPSSLLPRGSASTGITAQIVKLTIHLRLVLSHAICRAVPLLQVTN